MCIGVLPGAQQPGVTLACVAATPGPTQFADGLVHRFEPSVSKVRSDESLPIVYEPLVNRPFTTPSARLGQGGVKAGTMLGDPVPERKRARSRTVNVPLTGATIDLVLASTWQLDHLWLLVGPFDPRLRFSKMPLHG